jgi:hypothetical protein
MKKLKKEPDLETELLSAVEQGRVDQVLVCLERGTGTFTRVEFNTGIKDAPDIRPYNPAICCFIVSHLIFNRTSVFRIRIHYLYGDPDSNPGLKLANFSQREIKCYVFIYSITFKQFIKIFIVSNMRLYSRLTFYNELSVS